MKNNKLVSLYNTIKYDILAKRQNTPSNRSTGTLLSVKSDFVFKLIFGDQKNIDILGEFLRAVLDIPHEEYDHLSISDPHLKKRARDDKYSIIDVKLYTTSKKVIHIEIQRRLFDGFTERTLYAQSKLVTEQISAGESWDHIGRVISIIITEELYISANDRYHNQFRYRSTDGLELTNLVEINCLDLSKLPKEDDGTLLWSWMSFINAESEESLNMLATKSPQLYKAITFLRNASVSKRMREEYERREWARRDQAALLADRDARLAERDNAIAERNRIIAERDSVISEKESVISEKDRIIAELNDEIEKLRSK